MMKITVFGDSILKGVLLEDRKYVVNHAWERRLAEEFDLTIENRARFGCTLPKALPAIRRDCAAPEGEAVVLEFGGNDCDYPWAEIAAYPEDSYCCKTPPARFLEQYREAIASVRQSGRLPVVLNLPPIDSVRYLDFICRHGLSKERILHWLGDVEAIHRWQERYSEIAANLAKEEGAALIDLRAAFPSREYLLGDLLCADGIHPSQAGQERIYRTLKEAL